MPVIDGSWSTTTKSDFVLLAGYVPEDCGTPPIECNLEITGWTKTDVSVRGANDGSITVGITGASGNTQWYFNGAFAFSGVTNLHTFTGLTSGIYDVTIIDELDCIASMENMQVLDGEFRTGSYFVTSPTGLTAVDNPIIIGVSTAISNPNPLQNITTLTVSGTVANGFSIKFALTSPFVYNQTFYAKGYPNKPNYFLASVLNNQVGTPVGNNSNTEIATSLADALNNDSVIPKIYYINNNNTVVTLTAKESGTKFLLYTGNTICSGPEIQVSNIQLPTDYCDGQTTDNYSISVEVMANIDTTNEYPETGQLSDFNKVAELILPFSPDNRHRFDISGILKSQVSTPIPDLTLSGSSLMPSVMQPYFVKISELYPLVPNTNTIKKRYKTDTDVQWVINSSLDRYNINNMEAYLGENATNLNNNFTVSFVITNEITVNITNALLDTGNTGTTNIKYSLWNSTNSTIYEPWQSSNSFVDIDWGTYYARVSGITSGITFMYSIGFYVSPYSNSVNTTTNSAVKQNVKFLTNSPNPKQIQRSSNEFLYFILPKNYGKTLKVKGDLYFYDGTQVTGQTFFTISTGATNAGGCMVMNLSYDKLGLAAYEVSGNTNRKIKRAEIAVYQNDSVNGDFQYTEDKTYRFEIDEQPRKFGIVFQNALGMYDAFDFVGVVEETLERKVDTYTIPLAFGNQGSIGIASRSTSTYNTKITKKVVVNTGWIDEEHFDWLMELLKSSNIFNTNISTQNYLNLTNFEYKKSSLDDLFDAEFTFVWTIYDNAVTI